MKKSELNLLIARVIPLVDTAMITTDDLRALNKLKNYVRSEIEAPISRSQAGKATMNERRFRGGY